MSVKKRGYDYSYIQYGFTPIVINGEERLQCVICSKALSNDSMKPTKLKQHLLNVHPQHKDKEKTFLNVMGMLWIQQGHSKKQTKRLLKFSMS